LKIEHDTLSILGMRYPRTELEKLVRRRLRQSPAVALLGPRQCGKSTLARRIAGSGISTYFDLENPADLRALAEPMTTLGGLRGLVVIDEVQRRPDLFPVLRVLLDRKPAKVRFLVLGSAAPELLRQSSETLAGRVALVPMAGFNLTEVEPTLWQRLWLRGGFPRSFLARSQQASMEWRTDFISTFLERDLPQMGVRVPAAAMQRLWTMLAHYSGGIWNGSEIGNSLGEAHTTVRRHLDALSGALVVRVLQPWFENLGKRQVKSPKVYVRDTGLLHALLGIGTSRELDRHPKVGASWEGFVVGQVLDAVRPSQAFYWRTQSGAELDLLLPQGPGKIGVEVKYADAPSLTPSMSIACNDLGLSHLYVIYPGTRRYKLTPKITVVPLITALAEIAQETHAP
jgi:predicted AAA+ superfamily ATPase